MPKYTKKIASPFDMENLPDDVLPNIFIHLLAKQLAQMRCVCKSWNALLSGSNFVKSHLHRSIHKNDDILLFFKKGILFYFDSGPWTACPSHSPHVELTNFMKLKFPIDPHLKYAFGEVIGSVNGLICFSYTTNHKHFFIRIWNPSLSASLTLPPASLSGNGFDMAFGFDPKTDDYKVVKLAYSFDKKPRGEVYSMRNGLWELIYHSVPSHIKYFIYKNKVCVDGHIHWICVTNLGGKQETIVTFDLGAMTFGEIRLPYSILHGYRINELGVLGGKLCVMSRIEDGECEVWVMGDDKLWEKDHVFSQFISYRITPHGFTSQKEFLFQVHHDCHFGLYDPVVAKTKIFKIKTEQQSHRYDRYKIQPGYKIVEYVDSLVWIAPASRFKLAA